MSANEKDLICVMKRLHTSWLLVAQHVKDAAKKLTKGNDWIMLGIDGHWHDAHMSFEDRNYNVYRLNPDFVDKPQIEIDVRINGENAKLSDIPEKILLNLRKNN